MAWNTLLKLAGLKLEASSHRAVGSMERDDMSEAPNAAHDPPWGRGEEMLIPLA